FLQFLLAIVPNHQFLVEINFLTTQLPHCTQRLCCFTQRHFIRFICAYILRIVESFQLSESITRPFQLSLQFIPAFLLRFVVCLDIVNVIESALGCLSTLFVFTRSTIRALKQSLQRGHFLLQFD
ncbi:hypothetical protein PENTCL1PPCAC_24269, partial [Pristionchus entomophagus]